MVEEKLRLRILCNASKALVDDWLVKYNSIKQYLGIIRTIKHFNMTPACIFCDICSKKQPTDFLYEDEEIIVFKDIKPASTHHFLVIPKLHIKDVKVLTADDKNLVEKLVSIGKKVLLQNQGDVDDLRLGFHVPPFNSISHLHLHVISPVSNMSFLQRAVFKPNTWWFITPDHLVNILPPNKL